VSRIGDAGWLALTLERQREAKRKQSKAPRPNGKGGMGSRLPTKRTFPSVLAPEVGSGLFL
jgi:hypothetical protein